MASLEGNNEIVSSQDSGFGIRVEGYLNLCEAESEQSGKQVYHGVVEIVDDRGGVVVPVQIFPVVNQDEAAAVDGHFEMTEDAKAYVTEKAQSVFAGIVGDGTATDITPAMRIRAVYMLAANFERPQDTLMSMLQSLVEEDEDDTDFGTALLRGLGQ